MHSISTWPRRTALLAAIAFPAFAGAQDHAAAPDKAAAVAFTPTQQRGLDFLLAQQHDGKFLVQDKPHVGVSALALAAALSKPASARTDAERAYVQQATDYVLSQQNQDGSFGESLPNYQTSAAVMALADLGTDAAKAAVLKARDFLLAAQNAEASGAAATDKDYGGFGYGPGSRGDMSNTQFAVEALRKSGLDVDHVALQRAVAFLQRCQNLRSVNGFRTEASEQGSSEKFPVEPGNDGGACYLPGNSKFGFDVIADGVHVPRSYGSMTYALLKTYALCGVGAGDERMKAAVAWLAQHWTLDSNPGAHGGMGENAEFQGLFYYYETMARALTVSGIDAIPAGGDAAKPVAWRQLLAAHLAATQAQDGSWRNSRNGRWWEDQPTMCTIYALLALADCHKGGKSE